MPLTPLSPVQDFRHDQSVIMSLLAADVRALFQLLNPLDMSRTFPIFYDGLEAKLGAYVSTSALQASEFYDAMRYDAGFADDFDAELQALVHEEKLEKSLRYAVADLYSNDEEPDLDATLTKVQGVTQKIVADAGRDTIQGAIDSDPVATGFARQAKADACYFCALLATRGGVYKTAESAASKGFYNRGARGGRRVKGVSKPAERITKNEPYHDHCSCVAVPIFEGQTHEPDDHVKKWDALYSSVTGNVTGAEKIRAFRRAYESN